jgi:hypothetical protein
MTRMVILQSLNPAVSFIPIRLREQCGQPAAPRTIFNIPFTEGVNRENDLAKRGNQPRARSSGVRTRRSTR